MVCLIELLRLMMLRLCRFKSVMNLQLSMKERMIPANLRSLEMSWQVWIQGTPLSLPKLSPTCLTWPTWPRSFRLPTVEGSKSWRRVILLTRTRQQLNQTLKKHSRDLWESWISLLRRFLMLWRIKLWIWSWLLILLNQSADLCFRNMQGLFSDSWSSCTLSFRYLSVLECTS